jgi:hypothetical protein
MSRAEVSVSDLIEEAFPGVPWTGSSSIHRSWARSIHLEADDSQEGLKALMSKLVYANYGPWLFDALQEQFMGCEWLVSSEEFTKILLVDWWLSLSGEAVTTSPAMLKNPHTGNVFHRLAIKDGALVCGIRFWASVGLGAYLGFRFRVESMQEAEDSVRASARQKVTQAEDVFEPLMEELSIGEPTEEQLASARKSLRMTQEDPDDLEDY